MRRTYRDPAVIDVTAEGTLLHVAEYRQEMPVPSISNGSRLLS